MTLLQTTSDWLDPGQSQEDLTRRLLDSLYSIADTGLIVISISASLLVCWCLLICYRGMFKQQSFLVPSILLILIFFLPELTEAAAFLSLGRSPLGNPVKIVWLVGTTWLLWFLLGNQVAFGVTDRSIRRAIIDSASELRIQAVESFSSISFPTRSIEIQVSVHAWLGVALIRFKRNNKRTPIRALVKGIDRNLRLHPGERKTVVFWVHLIVAFLCLATTAWAFFYTRRR